MDNHRTGKATDSVSKTVRKFCCDAKAKHTNWDKTYQLFTILRTNED